jgi:hypothetical protein
VACALDLEVSAAVAGGLMDRKLVLENLKDQQWYFPLRLGDSLRQHLVKFLQVTYLQAFAFVICLDDITFPGWFLCSPKLTHHGKCSLCLYEFTFSERRQKLNS